MKNIFKSRTVWTLVLLILINITQAFSEVMPTEVFVAVNGSLAIIATYFRISPQAKL